jgi:hypothetical protein
MLLDEIDKLKQPAKVHDPDFSIEKLAERYFAETAPLTVKDAATLLIAQRGAR